MNKSQLFKQATATALPFTIFFTIMCVIMAILFAVSHTFANASNASNASDNSQTITTNDSVEVMLSDIQAAIDESGVQGITIVYNK